MKNRIIGNLPIDEYREKMKNEKELYLKDTGTDIDAVVTEMGEDAVVTSSVNPDEYKDILGS